MADFQLKVTAETQDAERKLSGVQKAADEATKPRQIKLEIPNYSDVSKNFSTLKKDIESTTNSIKQFYRIASELPVGPVKDINEVANQIRAVGTAANDSKRNIGDAGAVIRSTFESAGRAAENLVGRLTRIAFTIYAINEAVKVTQSAFSGLFSETLGREIKLRETILKAQTTLASTNKVFSNGTEITDPYQKIVALTGQVAERIDSIRERSIALAGVTSNEVIEVFGIVASQVGQIGGGLKEAEDLAINFAAALGTFGIPLYQAQQEIGSILRGDITTDSYLARALGITNQDIARAKSEAGGVVKFLEDRLAAAVAGQRIAAEGFAGVVSNIKDLSELINQNFGKGLLDPLLDGLTKVFNFLFGIRKELFTIASLAGSSLGNILSIGVGRTSGASGVGGSRTAEATTQALTGVEALIKRVTVEINKALSTVYLQLATLTERATAAFGALAKGLTALAVGLLSLQLENLKALIGAAEAISPALLGATKAASGFLAIWGEFLKLPVVQEISQISANMRLLQITGVMPLIKNGFLLKGVIENWAKVSEFVITQFNKLRAIIGGLIAGVGSLAIAASEAGRRLLAAWQPSGVALQALKAELQGVVGQLTQVGAAAQAAGSKIGSLNTEVRKGSGGVVTLITNFIKFNLLMFAISAILGLALERFGAWKEAQDKLASDKRAEEALRRLQTTYKDVGGSADEATKRAKAFEESLVNAKYDEAVQNLEDIRKKLAEIQDLTSGNNIDLGDYARRIAQLFNPANFDAFLDRRPGELFSDTVYRKRLEQEKKAEADKAKWTQEVNKRAAAENIKLEAQNRVNLEKEIKDIRLAQEKDLFRQRQTLAQKEVEIFRAAGELRIFQMEQANAKLIEGEEGASRAALEALNNYLSTRERGELDIEAAKQSIVIEIANLEREISNYRLENEKKIAEIRKRAGEYEQNVANYRRQMAGQTAAGTGGGAATFGSTGNVDNAAGWVHGHFQTNTGTLNDLIADTLPVLKGLLEKGIPVKLSDGTRIAAGKDDAYYQRQLRRAANQHGHSGDGRSLDLFVPEGTKVPVALTDITGNTGRGGITGGLPGSGKSWVGHLAPGSKAGGAATAAAPPAQPTAPSFDDIGAPAVERYAEAVRGVASALERARALQEALTNARTAAAFDAIAKAAFPQVAVEQYQDQLAQLQFTYNAVSTNAAAAFDPERTALEAERLAKITISNRELAEIKAGIATRENLSESERKRAMDSVLQQHKKYLADLERIDGLKRNILATEQITTFIQQSALRARDIEREIEALQLRNRLQAEGVAPELIQAELAKLEIQREMNRQLEQANGDLEKQAAIRAAAAKQATAVDALARAQTEPGTRIRSFIGEAERSLKDYEGMAIRVSQSVGDAVGNSLANGITGLIEGTTTIKDIFANLLKDLGRILLQEATKMIATYIAIGIAKMLAFGGSPNMGGGNYFDSKTGLGVAGPNFGLAKGGVFDGTGMNAFAKGGAFTNSVVSSPTLFQFADGGTTGAGNTPFQLGVMGEAGPEAIMPLKRGPDGRLGVAAHFSANRAAMGGGAAGGSSDAFAANREAMSATATLERERTFERVIAGGASSTEIKYSRVGSGDLPFVTEEDMLQASRIAAQEGARLGQQRTLAALKNNPAARRTVGI